MTRSIHLLSCEELKPGKFKSLDIEGYKILLSNIDGEYFAIEDRCSHEDSPLSLGCLKGDLISCTLHGSRFCVRNGQPMEEPAIDPVKTFSLVTKQNEVYIEIE